MKELKAKIQELLAYNEVEPVYTFGSKDPNSLDNIMKSQEKLQEEIDELAKANNTILGRQIKFPMGDGYAYYVITKVNKKTVEITWVKYCDAWQDRRAGYQSLLNFDYANQQVKGQDRLAELFGAKKLKVAPESVVSQGTENEIEVDCE
jgi:hypothetical protein